VIMKPVVLQAHGDVGRLVTCSDCKARGDGDVRADYLILVEDDPDWRAICEVCSYDYDWENAEVEIDL
jgi:hypothetical protein